MYYLKLLLIINKIYSVFYVFKFKLYNTQSDYSKSELNSLIINSKEK